MAGARIAKPIPESAGVAFRSDLLISAPRRASNRAVSPQSRVATRSRSRLVATAPVMAPSIASASASAKPASVRDGAGGDVEPVRGVADSPARLCDRALGRPGLVAASSPGSRRLGRPPRLARGRLGRHRCSGRSDGADQSSRRPRDSALLAGLRGRVRRSDLGVCHTPAIDDVQPAAVYRGG